jgi:alpha-mannosidase
MDANILSLRPRMSGLIFHLIAHTHWDREWYLPRAAFQARLVPALDDLFERLQADPGLKSFLVDGQTVLLEDYLRARPDREADVRTLVKTGRLQVGPWYVLADELIPSGESLVRNLLLGAADAERLGGRLDVLYSPDAFGHPAAWPALAREFGIKFGVLWRGLGGQPGQDRDLYRWRGPDGRDVLVWHLPPQGYEIGAALPEGWEAVRATLVDRAAAKHVPVFVGADHHAVHPQLTRLRDQLGALEPANAVRISRLDEFFQAVAEGAAAAPLVGELRSSYGYTWTLQGVHGTRAPLKRRHGVAELGLERCAEPLAALARRYGGRDRRPLLDVAWRTLVRAQFHDTLAGCTSDAVAAAAAERLAQVEALSGELARGALFDLAGHDPDAARERDGETTGALVLWNPAARPRGGVVVADITWFRRDVPIGPAPGTPRRGDGYRPFALRTPDGRVLPVQVLDARITQERLDATRHYPDQDEVDEVRVAFRMSPPAVPGLGVSALAPGAPASLPKQEGVRVRGRTLENRFVEVALEPSGALTLVDRRSGGRYPDLLRLEDAGDAGDTYTYCPPARDRVVRSRGPLTVRRLAAGPLVAALEARWPVTRRVDARLVVQLHADGPLVRCILDLDNRAPYHRLRARVPTGLADVAAVAGAAFGSVPRAAVTADPADFPGETPVRTAPAQRFVAAARGARGLALFAPGFFEYEWTAAGDLLFTLLRAVGELSRGALPTRPGHAGWPMATPGAQGLGPCRVELALAPVTEAQLERGDALPELWEDAFLPIRGVWLRDAGPLRLAAADITLEGTGLVLSAVKPAQAGSPTVLRCYNATDRKAAGAWRFGDGVKSAHRVRADERESVALVLEQRGRTVRFVAGPHEIVTILVT